MSGIQKAKLCFMVNILKDTCNVTIPDQIKTNFLQTILIITPVPQLKSLFDFKLDYFLKFL